MEANAPRKAKGRGLAIDFRQSDSEAGVMGWIKKGRGTTAGLILNPAGFTSTSIAILDALLIYDRPIIEVHISPLFRRDEFRHLSYPSMAASAKIEGFGIRGYEFALRKLAEWARG